MKKKISVALMLALLLISNFGVLINIQTAFASTADGVVATWHLDEGIGSVASDSSGFGNDAALSGGKFGNALYFDGDNDYVEVAFDSTIDFTALGQDFSAEAWINIEVAQDYNVIFQQEDTSIPGRSWLYIRYNGALRSFIGGTALETAGGYITLGSWHHVALSFDKEDGSQTGQLTLYVDGAPIVSEGRTLEPSTGDYRIGIHKNDIHDTTGRIDEVRLSNIARTTFSQIAPPSNDGDVAALWHFDESVGTEVYDEVNGNTGTLMGDTTWAGPTWTDGVFGPALQFDGVDDYIDVSDDNSLDITGEITIEAWIKPEDISTYKSLFVKGDAEIEGKINYGLQIQAESTPGTLRFFKWSPGYTWVDSTLQVEVGVWQHIAVTVDSGNNLNFYINGVPAGSGVLGLGPVSDSPLDIARHKHSSWGASQYYEGCIDEGRIWTRALSFEEVKRHAWGLVGKWNFNEDSGTTAFDGSGFGNDGSIVGATWTSDSKHGSALAFDGDDYVNVPNAPCLNIEQGTWEAWLKFDVLPSAVGMMNPVAKAGQYWIHASNGADDPYDTESITNTDSIQVKITVGGTRYIATTPADFIQVDEWYHVAGTYDGETLKLYVNGVLLDSNSNPSGPIDTQDPILAIGTWSTLIDYFRGTIDEVLIWNQALLPITFDQTGLTSAAQNELVVTVSDPIPLNYEDLPFVMMVQSGTEVTYEYEDPVQISPTVGFTLLDVTGPESPVTVNEPTTVTGNYFEWSQIVASKHDALGNPLSGWTMNLAGPDAQSADTGLDGTVTFTVKQPGDYHISETLEAGYTLISPVSNDYALTVAAGSTYGPYDFVNFEWMTLSGNKYELAYCDGFEDGEASDWTPVNGIWDVVMEDGDYAYRQSGIQYIPGIRVTGDSSWENYIVEAKVKSMGTTEFRYGGLLLRVADPGTAGTAGTYYELYLQENGRLQLVRTVSGVRTGITNPAVGSFYNEWWNIKAQVIDGNIKAKAWEVGTTEPTDWIIDWTDPTPIPAGKIGLITFHKTDPIYNQEPVYFDDICIKVPLSDWDMSLYSQSDLVTPYATDTTDEYGYYEFTVKDPDIYNIYEYLEEGWTELYPEYVLGNGDNELGYTGITVASGVDQTGFDFVNFEWATVTITKEDTSEKRVEGWEITVGGQTGYTDVYGEVEFTLTAPGEYTVVEETRSDWTAMDSTTWGFTAQSGGSYSHTFSNFKHVIVSGHKWEYVFFDYFEDETLGEEASNWDTVTGTWIVENDGGNKVLSQTSPGGGYVSYAKIDGYDFTDGVIQAKVKSVSGTAGNRIIWRGDGDAQSNYYYFGFDLVSNDYVVWGKFVDGEKTQFAAQLMDFDPGVWYTLKVIANGNHFEMYVDCVKIFDDTDDSLASGSVGFHCGDATQYDDVFVGEPLEGWTIKLFDDTPAEVASTTTDVQGYYAFTITEPGAYAIKEMLKEEWTAIIPNYVVGNEAGGGTEDVEGYSFSVASGVDMGCKDFVNFEWVTISGHKYEQIYCDDFDSTLAGTDPMYWSEHGVGTWYVEQDSSAPSQGFEGYGDVYVGDASSTLYTRDFSFITLAPDFSNGVFEFKFKLDSTSTPTPRITIPVRYQDDSNWVLFDIDTGVYRTGYYIFSTESGWTELAGKSASITKDAWHTMKIVLDGWNYEMWIDGVLELTAYDGTEAFSSGKIGLGVYRNTVARFDDVCLLAPLSGWEMSLYSQSDLVTPYALDTTDEYGYYEFTVKDPDIYNIYEYLEEGWTELYPMYLYGNDQEELGYTGITVASGVDQTGFDFVNFKWVTIDGHKYFDGNGDGEWNNDEPYLDGWTIKLNDDTETAITGPDGDPSWTTGYYSFLIKDPGVYKVSEETPEWWIKTEPEGDYHTVIVQSGTDVELNFGNWLGPSWVSTSSLCRFDMDEAEGQQFRIIFTPDIFNNPNEYKISATNPGQFYYNVFYSGQDIEDTFMITLPEDFATKGANPVHVYDSLNAGPYGCLIPGEDVSGLFTIVIVDNVVTVTPISPYDGFIYINVHCEYAPEQTGGYEQIYYDDEGVIRGHATIDGAVPPTIPDLCDHDFNVVFDGVLDDTVTVESRNTFKKIRGIVGFVKDDGEGVEGVAVTIEGPFADAELMTDEDGFYGYDFFHLGKPAIYTVTFGTPVNDDLTVKLKAGHFAEVSYSYP